MRVVIGQRMSPRSNVATPRGAAAGTVSGCGWGGGAAVRNPAPQARVGVRYYGTNTRQAICFRGVNGQLVCPNNEMNMRARGGTSQIRKDWISTHRFSLPGGTDCFLLRGQWHCY